MMENANTSENDERGTVGAIIVAAGRGLRMGGQDKTLTPVMGKPLVLYSLEVFSDSPGVTAVVLVVSAENMDACRRLVEEHGLDKVAGLHVGGKRRQDSVSRGLEAMPDTAWTIVHDGARPCVDAAMIARGIGAAHRHGAAVAAVPVKDTIKAAGNDRTVSETIDRERLWAAQTPQVFRTELLRGAHRSVKADVTDDAAMVEACGGTVSLFMGSYENIKVTTPEDIAIAEAILARRPARVPGGTR